MVLRLSIADGSAGRILLCQYKEIYLEQIRNLEIPPSATVEPTFDETASTSAVVVQLDQPLVVKKITGSVVDDRVRKAEALYCLHLVECFQSFRSADNVSKLFNKMFF